MRRRPEKATVTDYPLPAGEAGEVREPAAAVAMADATQAAGAAGLLGGIDLLTLELRHRWFGPDLLPALAELSLAEHRAHRRRLRFACPPEASGGAVGP